MPTITPKTAKQTPLIERKTFKARNRTFIEDVEAQLPMREDQGEDCDDENKSLQTADDVEVQTDNNVEYILRTQMAKLILEINDLHLKMTYCAWK